MTECLLAFFFQQDSVVAIVPAGFAIVVSGRPAGEEHCRLAIEYRHYETGHRERSPDPCQDDSGGVLLGKVAWGSLLHCWMAGLRLVALVVMPLLRHWPTHWVQTDAQIFAGLMD